MAIIPFVTAVTAALDYAVGSLAGILPGLRGKTQHMDYTQADPLARTFGATIFGHAKKAYPIAKVNGEVAEKYRVKLLNFIESSGRWRGTDKTLNAVAVLSRGPERENWLPPIGSATYFQSVATWHALWILTNMDISSDSEFKTCMQSDLQRFTLVPALEESGLNSGAMVEAITAPPAPAPGTTAAGFDWKTLLAIGIGLFIVVGLMKRKG
jgi:hypothetical protein